MNQVVDKPTTSNGCVSFTYDYEKLKTLDVVIIKANG